jgi:hypothetical protein
METKSSVLKKEIYERTSYAICFRPKEIDFSKNNGNFFEIEKRSNYGKTS